jgi:TP901 family phage tail tape measure protein
MFSAGSVQAVLSGNFNPAGFMAFDRAMHKSAATMASSEKRMAGSQSRMSRGMAAVGRGGAMALAGGVLAAGVAISKSVSLAADFEEQLSRLKATTGAGAAAMKGFKKDAMDAGAATKFSALDAAKAQVELAKGGLAVKDMSGGLKAAVGLAAAGEIDLALAGETVVNAMKQFKIEGGDATHVADALATAANATTADVGHFAMALTQGGAAAKAAGMNLDETVALLEAFADNSVKGSDAGTSMKAMLTQLAAPTAKQSKAARDLNLELWDQQGNLKPLPQMAKALDAAFGGLTNKERLKNAATIAGTDGMRGLLALYASSPGKMQAYLDGLKEQGTAADVADKKQDNLRGNIEQLKGSLETAGIALGEGLLPALSEGAEKLTGTINEMTSSGDLQQMGKDLGDIVNSLVEAGPAIAEGFSVGLSVAKGLLKAVGAAALTMLVPINVAAKALLVLGKAANLIPGVDIDLGGLESASKKIDSVVDSISNNLRGIEKKSPTIRIKGDASQATAALKRVQAMGLSDKVMRILGKDISAAAKIKQLRAMGIDPKTARILGQNADAISKIGSVRGALAQIPSSKNINLTVTTTAVSKIGAATNKILEAAKRKGRAKGRGPGGSEVALTGEGRGPELVGSASTGFQVVSEPTLLSLGPTDYVVPFGDPSQSGRALGLMMDMFGIRGYAKGKKASKKKGAAKPRDLPVPQAVQFGAVPSDELDESRDKARESYQKRKERVRDLGVDIRSQKGKVASAKKGPAKRAAQRKLSELRKDQRRYRDGGDGLQSLAAMRKQWQDLQKQSIVLAAHNREIERLNTLQETDRTRMATASKLGDSGAWTAAKKRRGGTLATLKAKYARALKLAKPGSVFAAELESKLAGVEGEIADVAGEAFEPPEVKSPFEGGMTEQERATLEGLEAAQSLAALTAGTEDDRAAAVATEGFLTGILGAVQRDPSRGGAAAIRDVADRVAQARSNVASFAGGAATSNENADVQAQLEQAREVARVAQRESDINRLGLATFKGAGDIGMGGPRIIINTLHPGDPATLRAIGDAAVGGMSLQGSVSSPRTNLGL